MHEIRFQSAVNYDDSLWRAAAESAVDTNYWDIFGHQHHVTREALQAILAAIGWNTGSLDALEDGRRRRFSRDAEAGLAGTAVVGEREKWMTLFIPNGATGTLVYTIHLENGGELSGRVDLQEMERVADLVLDERRWHSLRFNLPAELPLGYHTLTLMAQGRQPAKCQLIVCPHRAYLPDFLNNETGRTAGFNVALYGLRSQRNWGVGDFTDLRRLIDWARREIGFSMIGLNPLHALHNRTPYNASPYLPLSMYYKNLLYIDVEAVPEFAYSSCARKLFNSEPVKKKLQLLRDSELVQYSEVALLKRRFLKLLHRTFRSERANHPERNRAFAEYCEREGDLLSKFALYCALDEALHKKDRNAWSWRDWPEQFQSPDSTGSLEFAKQHVRSVEFYKYVQFVLEEQLAAAQQHAKTLGMPVGLYHDLAVATDSFGSDLWIARDHYVTGARVGAPPDDFSPQGQDWGFPPPNKEVHRAEGYQLFRESIRKIVRHGGALRIDHVMRLFRLFWVPPGMPPSAGAYVRDYAADLMHVLALESVRSQNIIVGEDLGTVTDEMRELFQRFGILSYRLFPFERNYQTGEFKHSFAYPRQALVSSSTHDLPTLAGFWRAADIEDRRAAGLADEASYQNQLADRRREKQRMLDILHSEGLLPPSYTRDAGQLNDLDGDLHNAIVAFLARVPSLVLLLNQEDFTKEPAQQNLPGSTAEYPNWQRKMRYTIEQLNAPETEPYAAMFKYQLMSNGRT
ncbi:MAG TPA: 4-alpha-glucanotransferase [Bryobacteraceae bacterium]|nr:4-alpha-glucanotransferase [Bryobacteraceae bacterium]